MQTSCDRNDDETSAKADDFGVGTSNFGTLMALAANTDKTAQEFSPAFSEFCPEPRKLESLCQRYDEKSKVDV